MGVEQAVVLGFVQGLTEFLPVSSSAHLILAPVFMGWDDQGLAFDVAVHVGTLIAVVGYFRQEVRMLVADWFASLRSRHPVRESPIAWNIVIATVPAALCGYFLGEWIEIYLRSPLVIAFTTFVFGIVLWWADVRGRQERTENTLRWRDAFLIGLFQMLALIPGTSRSGITLTAGLLLGLSRRSAARFSFLLSIPVIALAGGAKAYDLFAQQTLMVAWPPLLVGVTASAISAYFCLHAFLLLLEKVGVLPFVLYRLVLGLGLFVIFY